MSKWYEGSNIIECELEKIILSFDNYGKHYSGVVKLMPGIVSAILVEEGKDYVVIKTNEGTMTLTNISQKEDTMSLTIEFDEEYKAGKGITVISHTVNKFESKDSSVKC
jgi:hypothetical protein